MYVLHCNKRDGNFANQSEGKKIVLHTAMDVNAFQGQNIMRGGMQYDFCRCTSLQNYHRAYHSEGHSSFFYFCIMIIFGEANFLDLPQVHVNHNNLTDPLSFLLPAGLDYFCPSWLLPFQSGHSTNRLERGTRERRALSGVKSPNTAPRPPVTSFPDAQGADGRCNNCQRKESGADLMAARLIEKTFTMYHWQNLDIHATLQS